MKPSERMRERLREFDPAQQLALSEERRAEIARVLRTKGPAVIRRAKRQALLLRVAGGGVTLAAAAVLIAFLPSWRAAERTDSTPEPAQQVAACASDSSAAPRLASDTQGRKVLESGRARVVAEAESSIALEEFAPCRTTFALARGTLTVHARDLGGGELKIRSQDREVVVRGTLFRVEAKDSGLRVAVEHGRVTVHHQARTLATVHANQVVLVDEKGVTLSSLPPEEGAAMRAALLPAQEPATATLDVQEAKEGDGPAPLDEVTARAAPEAPRPARRAAKSAATEAARMSEPFVEGDEAPEALFARAEALWRKRERAAARALYRRVGSSPSPIAETAWLRMARLELDEGDAKAALRALAGRKTHLRDKELGAEAAWLEVEALAAAARYGEAEQAAKVLIQRFPKSPQAAAAQRLLAKSEKP